MHFLLDEYFQPALRRIDRRLPETAAADRPALFAPLPLSIWGVLSLDVPAEFPNLAAFLPRMPPDALQAAWVGASGARLLQQSLGFVEAMMRAYRRHGRGRFADARILDFGCGWGRHLRLLSRFVPVTALHGVDISPEILALARDLGVKGHLAQIPERADRLPFAGPYDLIYAFSVLTHLSEAAHRHTLDLWARHLAPGGIVAVTVRPRAYWTIDPGRPNRAALLDAHDRHGFAFVPHGPETADYGDTSISPAYIQRHWPGWQVLAVDVALNDPYQTILVLRRA